MHTDDFLNQFKHSVYDYIEDIIHENPSIQKVNEFSINFIEKKLLSFKKDKDLINLIDFKHLKELDLFSLKYKGFEILFTLKDGSKMDYNYAGLFKNDKINNESYKLFLDPSTNYLVIEYTTYFENYNERLQIFNGLFRDFKTEASLKDLIVFGHERIIDLVNEVETNLGDNDKIYKLKDHPHKKTSEFLKTFNLAQNYLPNFVEIDTNMNLNKQKELALWFPSYSINEHFYIKIRNYKIKITRYRPYSTLHSSEEYKEFERNYQKSKRNLRNDDEFTSLLDYYKELFAENGYKLNNKFSISIQENLFSDTEEYMTPDSFDTITHELKLHQIIKMIVTNIIDVTKGKTKLVEMPF